MVVTLYRANNFAFFLFNFAYVILSFRVPKHIWMFFFPTRDMTTSGFRIASSRRSYKYNCYRKRLSLMLASSRGGENRPHALFAPMPCCWQQPSSSSSSRSFIFRRIDCFTRLLLAVFNYNVCDIPLNNAPQRANQAFSADEHRALVSVALASHRDPLSEPPSRLPGDICLWKSASGTLVTFVLAPIP